MRSSCTVLHLDLDAFFAAVEQRDKPSLRGKPVCVGGTGQRGVVATASYEARRFGARSAMPTWQARRACPAGTAFLAGRFEAYRRSSRVVMGILRELSPLVEQVSVDEAFVDLEPTGLDAAGLREIAEGLGAQIEAATGGLTASVGLASSKMMAKIASEMGKPAGVVVVEPGEELEVLHPLPVRTVPGIGPATHERLRRIGIETVGDLAKVSEQDLTSLLGSAHGKGLYALARAQDDRPVTVEREAKSLSAEETFATDVTDRAILEAELGRMAAKVAGRLAKAGLFGRTITIKVRHHDFTTHTRSGTLASPTGQVQVVRREAVRLLRSVDVSGGLRLLGLGISGLTTHAQDELDWSWEDGDSDSVPEVDADGDAPDAGEPAPQVETVRSRGVWAPGQDVIHAEHGPGWVWGSGRGIVTVRFEGPLTEPGPVRSFRADDTALSPGDPPDWRLPRDEG